MTPADIQKLCGWVKDDAERDRIAAMQPFPVFGDAAPHLKDSGKGREIFLWQIEEKLTGKPVRQPHHQLSQDCVSHATSGAGEDLIYIEIADGKPFSWKAIASEPIYGGGRHQIGGDRLGRGGGMVVGWAIEWGKQFGLLPRGKYGNIDLTTYNVDYVNQWSRPRAGCPPELANEAKKFPLVTCSLIEGPNYYEQARDAIANKALIVTGSNQLFSQRRGNDGFITPDGHGGHSTYFRAVTDNAIRPGIGYQGSWGPDYHVGPDTVTLPGGTQVTLPKGFGFIDADTFNRMHRGQELWAVIATDGYVLAPPDWEIKFY
jgi:hypothetical protein